VRKRWLKASSALPRMQPEVLQRSADHGVDALLHEIVGDAGFEEDRRALLVT
jgi:hypothetical protein